MRRRGVPRWLPLGGLVGAFALCALPVRMSAQLPTSLSPPIFALPAVKDTFPGSTALVPPIGTVTAPVVATDSLNEVSRGSTVVGTVGSVGQVVSDPGSAAPAASGRGGPQRPLQNPILEGLSNRNTAQRRLGGAPLGGLLLSRESSSYTKLDALSPELLAARRATPSIGAVLPVERAGPSTSNAGLGSNPGLSFAFHPYLHGGMAVSHSTPSTPQTQAETAARSRQAALGSSLKSLTIRPSAKSVPRIPHVGIDLRKTAPSLR